MATIKTRLKISRYDSKKVLLEVREQPSRSWLKHFFDILYIKFNYQSTLAGITDVGGTGRTLGEGSACDLAFHIASMPGGVYNALNTGYDTDFATFDITTQPNGELVGIVVGSSNVAVAPSQNSLNTRIVHGAGAGQLLYGGTAIFAPVFADPDGSLEIKRYLTNDSGGDVTIQEVGIYAPIRANSNNVAALLDICRDVVAPAVVVADTQILEVVYTVQITV